MSVEALAVAEIMRIVSRCTRLEPVLATQDRVPLTDGHIDVWSTGSNANRDWDGRVNVQVKGRTKKKNSAPNFRLKRDVLEAHLKNQGVLLLCVDVDQKKGKAVPSYAMLTPFKIQRILDALPEGQQTASVPLLKFPRSPGEVERIMRVALAGSRQNPFFHTDPRFFESVRHFTISTVDNLDFQSPMRLSLDETAFVVEVTTENGSRMAIDGDFEILPSDYMPQERDLHVSAGDVVYERFTVQRIAGDQTCVTLEDGLSIVFRLGEGRRAINVNIDYPSNFVARQRALGFMIGLADTGQIAIGDRTLTMEEPLAAETPGLGEMRDHLQFLESLRDLFDTLGVDGALVDLDDLTDEHFGNLRVLYDVFVKGAAPGNTTERPGRTFVSFGEWAVMLVVVQGDGADTWRYIDPFHPDSPQMFRWAAQNEQDKTIPVTAYDVVEVEHLPRVVNLRLDLIDAAYERIAQAETTAAVANQCMRDLLDCVDAGGPRREEFLRGAERLNEWIIRHDGETAVHLLNRWQIAWRNEALTNADRMKIRGLKRESVRSEGEMAVQQELACALLLEERHEVEYLTGRLTKGQRTAMEGWPIWELYRKLALD
ncbi:hypothetical protein [Isoptericola sp. NPDC056134]|uniref:hypothetical protein n=1 Tax=Isoptericola sp. NPDC056134 TaxID=3345723 RepID=UPI0035EFC28F